jgi:hypothetical protein
MMEGGVQAEPSCLGEDPGGDGRPKSTSSRLTNIGVSGTGLTELSTAPPRSIHSPNRSATRHRSSDSTSVGKTDSAAPSTNTSMLPELGG